MQLYVLGTNLKSVIRKQSSHHQQTPKAFLLKEIEWDYGMYK